MNTFITSRPMPLENIQFAFPGDDHTRGLEKILRGEKSAVEAYNQVIEKFREDRPRVVDLLTGIARDHEDAVFDLSQLIRDEGIEPDAHSGPWGSVVHGVLASATLFGKSGSLWALRKGEEMGLDQYRLAVEESEYSEVRNYIRFRSIPVQERHIDRLSTLLYLQSVDRAI